jgi:hypothetical protein
MARKDLESNFIDRPDPEIRASRPTRMAEGRDGTCREWLGLKDLTHYADISERTLRSWIYSPVDPLPAAKVSGKVLVRKSDFDKYLEKHRVKPLGKINLDGIVRDVLEGACYGRQSPKV